MYILHLSDLHFGTLNDAKLWQSQLAQDLRGLKCLSIDALILSGDIANKSTPEEYASAKNFLDNFCEEFPIKRQNVVIVPGNHDLNWILSEDAYTLVRRRNYSGSVDSNRIIDQGGDAIEVRDEEQYQHRFDYFSKFYEDVTGEPYPLTDDLQGILYPLAEQKILFLGLNSAWELDHYYKQRASINPQALSNALKKIRQNSEYNNWLKIAVWHHPLNSNSEDRIKDHGFMEQLAEAGFRLALHGHIHKADNILYRYDRSIGGRKIEVISAGTFGAHTRELVTGYPWQYQLLKLENDKLTVYTRKREELNGAWKPDGRWTTGDGVTTLSFYEIDLGSQQIPKNEQPILETQSAASRSLTNSERKRLEQRLDALQVQWQLTMDLLAQLRKDLGFQADAAVKFQLQQQIKSAETQLSQLDTELTEIEEKLKKS
ncbi:hypothetical protein NIES37_24480 [Tolypothrix tenuis PCC 7101]|uniref:Calcineurin-like phosphoesterase domain-containing protein n=1 Tax=Tolypothrix tenuis PCC 7101 TaxID=231146 RepID=A0A1Z4MYF1_9CYAN|nr:metallophosphoesterase [Aulosira sp. FACHB-113]BAY98498.1 hypothetical protein NIES37_24480 [Tolypothrix tenuis PCC 7101]BAZ77583.1 hypothetical protein NIES50_62140 [Aulosira laxa NIES-50]